MKYGVFPLKFGHDKYSPDGTICDIRPEWRQNASNFYYNCHTSMYERDYNESERIDKPSLYVSLIKTTVVQKHKLSSQTCSCTYVGMQPYQGQLTKQYI